MWGHTAFGGVEASQQGDPHVAMHVVGVDVGKERCAGEPGVVDENVDPAPGLQSTGHHRLGGGRVGNVAVVGDGLPAGVADALGGRLGDVGVDALLGQPQRAVAEVVEHDLGAAFGQVAGVGETQADLVSGPGNQGHPALELICHD